MIFNVEQLISYSSLNNNRITVLVTMKLNHVVRVYLTVHNTEYKFDRL